MKSQRRHDLQTNELAKGIIKIPTFFERHGNKLFIAAMAIALAIIIFNWRTRSQAESKARCSEALATARTSISQLRELGMAVAPAQQAQIAAYRTELMTAARTALDTVTSDSDDRQLLAEALAAKGDLNWQIANLPPLPGAATQPTLRLEVEPDQALSAAESDYKRVLADYPDQRFAKTAAEFGLAAIAENRGQWDAAQHTYETLSRDTSAPKPFQDEAKLHLELLKHIQAKPYLGKPTSRPAVSELLTPTTFPSADLGPLLPATNAAAPATKAAH